MSSTRVPKIEDFLKKEISQIISSQAKDPRYKFLNIVDVKCSSDLGVAKVFYTIIEQQTKNKMVAEASPEYAFVAVSPSMVPEEKSQPQRALICILGTLLGGILSVLLVLIMHYARNSD